MKIRNWVASGLGLIILSAAPILALAKPALKLVDVSVKAGNGVEIPVSLKAGSSSIAALQFSITLPATVTPGSVTPSDALKSSGKNVIATVRENVWTFIVYGPNQSVIPSGELFKASVKISADSASAKLQVPVSAVVFSDPKAQAIPGGPTVPGIISVEAVTASPK